MRRNLVSLFSLLAVSVLVGCVASQEPRPQTDSGPRVATTPPRDAQAPELFPMESPPVVFTQRIPPGTPAVKIGLLVPLSGESRALGHSMLDAATLALYDYYLPLTPDEISASIVLVPKDTGYSTASAKSAARQVLLQDVDLIIGPVYSASVSSSASLAKQQQVPMLSLSNNRAVAAPGIYVFGFLPEQQVKRMAEHFVLKNIASIGAILPNDAYGQTIAETLRTKMGERGIRVGPIEFYSRTPENMAAAVARLKQGYNSDSSFEALFIAEGGENLSDIANALSAQGLDSRTVRYIGTGVWDEPEVYANPNMQGAWFISSPPNHYKAFEKRFRSAFGYTPQRLSSLAYDAVTLSAALVLNRGGANFAAPTLASPQGFIGPANGLYRLKPDGTSERGLVVIEIEGGKPRILGSAPLRFDD